MFLVIAHIGAVPVEETLIDWSLLMMLAAPLWLYLRGWARLTGLSDRHRRNPAFLLAMVTLIGVLSGPVEEAAEAMFSAHMIQHLFLLVTVPVLLVYGRAGRCIVAGLPGWLRRSTLTLRRSLVQFVARTRPLPVVVVLFGIVLWGWHLPVLYDAAVRIPVVHGVEHLTLLAVALLLWMTMMDSRIGLVPRAIVVFTTAFHSGLLGAILVFAPIRLYAVHGEMLFGIDPLTDQQTAGAIMWLVMGGTFLATTASLVIRQLSSPDPRVAVDA